MCQQGRDKPHEIQLGTVVVLNGESNPVRLMSNYVPSRATTESVKTVVTTVTECKTAVALNAASTITTASPVVAIAIECANG